MQFNVFMLCNLLRLTSVLSVKYRVKETVLPLLNRLRFESSTVKTKARFFSFGTKSEKKMDDFTFPNEQPVSFLYCQSAFDALTEKEKLYAHYLSRAAWYGGLIDLVQTSLESPLIFCLLHELFRAQPIAELKKTALEECGFSEDEFTAVLVYTSGILSNMGNYKGYGDKKFIPNLPKEKFESLIRASKAFRDEQECMEHLLTHCLEPIYSLKDKDKQLGFPDIGTTTYISKNLTKKDQEIVKEFLKKQNIEAYNSRLFKTVDSSGKLCYEIRLASILQTDDEEDPDSMVCQTLNGHKFLVTRGDYSELLKLVNKNLALAKDYAANENEVRMLECYMNSFKTGSLDSHKEGSRYWVKNKSPIIEFYIGFIETYRDPAGMRGEFEGFVAMVNKLMSAKFCDLVNASTELMPLLPWPRNYDVDKFLRPDFTSLDVLTFANSGIPAGICIPNYDVIRQSEGFKNVSLGNIISLSRRGPANFLNKSDQDFIEKYDIKSFELQVGLHELLGHGTGKLFRKRKDGSYNFDIEQVMHFETNEKITSWYEEGETYDSVFGAVGSSYEECRAECVGLYLCTEPQVLRIFGHEGAEAEDVMYVNWLCHCLRGVESLQLYEPKTQSWLQAHAQARYVILQVLLEESSDFVKVEQIKGADGNPDLLLTVDRSQLKAVGKPIIGKFLKKLQLYRSTADVKSAKQMYEKYSAVTSEDRYPFLDYREIVMARKKPRMMFVEANTFLEEGGVRLQSYESSHEGMIQSWKERFPDLNLTEILTSLYEKDKPHFI